MANLVVNTATNTGHLCYVALDAYFSTGPMFLILKAAVNDSGQQLVHVVTRAKDNYVGFHDRQFSNKKYHDQDKVKLMEWFQFPEFFETVELKTYNKTKTIEYACLDLLWQPINDFVRFVCVKDTGRRYILMSSDLNLCPTDIITIYSYRSKIEVMFLFLKHLIGGFCYHFWTHSLPKLNCKKQLDLSTLNEMDLKKVSCVVEAIERFVNLAGIALGLLQYLALTQTSRIWDSYQGWLRTRTSETPSEAVVQSVLQTEFFSSAWKVPFCGTLRIIQRKMRKHLLYKESDLSNCQRTLD
jgi:hypothetical protein